MKNNIFLNKPIQEDNIYIDNKIVSLESITGMPNRKGLERAVISAGTIVNVVSKSYAHLPNEKFFYAVEEALINAELNYITRSINRDNRSFAVDYILQDERYQINVKNGMDKIKPMLRFTNSYDGSTRTSGHFGFFREVCKNGLHVATQNIGFSVKHKGNMDVIVIPKIDALVKKFMDNEFYTLQRKFESLCESKIHDTKQIVKDIAEQSKLFKFEKSDLNVEPSLTAQLALDIIERESRLLNEVPNKWHAYNAFNEIIHGKLKLTFGNQRKKDADIFEMISAY